MVGCGRFYWNESICKGKKIRCQCNHLCIDCSKNLRINIKLIYNWIKITRQDFYETGDDYDGNMDKGKEFALNELKKFLDSQTHGFQSKEKNNG